jgi:hypothetical protein
LHENTAAGHAELAAKHGRRFLKRGKDRIEIGGIKDEMRSLAA